MKMTAAKTQKESKAYTKSNKVESLKVNKLKVRTKKLFVKLREQATITQDEVQLLSNMICSDFGVANISITFDGVEPHRVGSTGSLRSKTHGIYRYSKIGSVITYNTIKVYKYTAKRKQVRANKSVLDTLLHELCHYFDFCILKLDDSLHTAGFYKRISSLKDGLLN
jgi:hypothetical protein